MAIFDALVTLAGSVDAGGNVIPQLITALGATAGNGVVDMGPLPANQPMDFKGDDNCIVTINITQSLTSGGAATVRFQLVRADDQALSANVQVLQQTDDLPYTLLTAGKKLMLRLSSLRNSAPPGRYFGLRVVIGGAALTNAAGWLFAAEGATTQDLSPTGRGYAFKAGFSVA